MSTSYGQSLATPAGNEVVESTKSRDALTIKELFLTTALQKPFCATHSHQQPGRGREIRPPA